MDVQRVSFVACIVEYHLHMVSAMIGIAGIITAAFLNCNLYVSLRRHEHQIQALHLQQLAQNDEMTNAGRMKKSAIATIYLYLVFMVFYLPSICTSSIISKTPEPSTVIEVLHQYTLTLLFLNSSLNPLIYAWKMRHIRHTVIDLLRKAFSSHT